MKYLATIKDGILSYSRTFNTMAAAEQWLDEQNHNEENTTLIEVFDENWNKVDGFMYTEKK